jgi:ribonuclease VapC
MVAILYGEADGERYLERITGVAHCRMSTATFVELSIVVHRQLGEEGLRQAQLFIERAGVQLEPVSVEQALVAQRAFVNFGKGRHRAGLNFGDCFSYALAVVAGEPLLFKGKDFSLTDIEPAL